MFEELFALTQEFCAVHAGSGREYDLAEMTLAMAKPYCDDCYIDRVGNVVCTVNGTGENRQKLLFSAHMDEVSMVVTFIEDNGYIRFTNNGGPNFVSAAYREVIFESGMHGMLVPPANGSTDPTQMVVDIGAKNREEAEKSVAVGDSFYVPSAVFRMTGNTLAGRPVDDRIGMAVVFLAMKELYERGTRPYNDIVFAFSVQEETALPAVGATVLAHEIEPDVGIAVDVCGTGDVPGCVQNAVRLGSGAALLSREPTLVADRALLDTMIRTAKEQGITYQVHADVHGGTDAVAYQKVGRGAKAGVISIPMRYLHTSAETADLFDADECRKLMLALCDVTAFERTKRY